MVNLVRLAADERQLLIEAFPVVSGEQSGAIECCGTSRCRDRGKDEKLPLKGLLPFSLVGHFPSLRAGVGTRTIAEGEGAASALPGGAA